MAIRPDGPAPYAPPATIIEVIEGYRDRGWQPPITQDVLIRAGVTESLAPRVLQTLRNLDLLDDDGAPTSHLEALQTARGEEEYKARLQEWLRGEYADILQYADPATDSADRLAEAFRGYTPTGQRNRMVTLMVGLFQYAGLAPEGRPAGKAREKSNKTRSVPRPQATVQKRVSPPKRSQPVSPAYGDLPPALVGLLEEIPRGGQGWTSQRRDEFLAAFRAVLDFSVPVVEQLPASKITLKNFDDEWTERM